MGIINNNPNLPEGLIGEILTKASATLKSGDFASWESIVAIISNYGNRINTELMTKTVENLIIMLKKNEFFSDEESFVEMITKYSDFPKELIKEVFQKKMRPYNEYRKRSSWEIETFWDNKLIKAILKNPVYNSYVIEPITAMLTKNSTIGEDEKFADEQSAVAIIKYCPNLPKDVIQKIFKTATHLKIKTPEGKKLLGGRYDVNDKLVEVILGNETYASYIDQKAIAAALTNASKLRKDRKALVNKRAVDKILEKFPLGSFDPFIVQALWANPGTSDPLFNYIFNHYKEKTLLNTLPPRTPSPKATAAEIHTAMLPYIDTIKTMIKSNLGNGKLFEYEKAKDLLCKYTKNYFEGKIPYLEQCIDTIEKDSGWKKHFQESLTYIVNFLINKTSKSKVRDHNIEILRKYMDASFTEEYDEGKN